MATAAAPIEGKGKIELSREEIIGLRAEEILSEARDGHNSVEHLQRHIDFLQMTVDGPREITISKGEEKVEETVPAIHFEQAQKQLDMSRDIMSLVSSRLLQVIPGAQIYQFPSPQVAETPTHSTQVHDRMAIYEMKLL
jgi:hypothetical protein